MFKKILSMSVMVCFFLTSLGPLPKAHADTVLGLPTPGTMINLSPTYEPVMIKGLSVHKDNPFLFDFIVDVGQDKMSGQPLKKEGEKLIKYFLASLAIPDKDVWVNLSPYEKDRMIPQALGQTDMGRDLLEQDYILKQITASLIYPEKQIGKTFWDRVYAKAQAMYGTTQIPVNTFNKVWIMADRAEVFEHNQTAFVVDSHLKVMLEEDYLALQKHKNNVSFPQRQAGDMTLVVSPSRLPTNEGLQLKAPQGNLRSTNTLASQIVREIVLPELEKEVNTGKNFANLRQIFNSIILSSWYKNNLKQAVLNQVYANHSKVKGINLNDPTIKERIYQQYLKAYKKGVFNYIKEEVNAANGETLPRKYFSGGMAEGAASQAMLSTITDLAMGSEKLAGQNFYGEVDFKTFAATNAPISNQARIEASPAMTAGRAKEIVRLAFNEKDGYSVETIGEDTSTGITVTITRISATARVLQSRFIIRQLRDSFGTKFVLSPTATNSDDVMQFKVVDETQNKRYRSSADTAPDTSLGKVWRDRGLGSSSSWNDAEMKSSPRKFLTQMAGIRTIQGLVNVEQVVDRTFPFSRPLIRTEAIPNTYSWGIEFYSNMLNRITQLSFRLIASLQRSEGIHVIVKQTGRGPIDEDNLTALIGAIYSRPAFVKGSTISLQLSVAYNNEIIQQLAKMIINEEVFHSLGWEIVKELSDKHDPNLERVVRVFYKFLNTAEVQRIAISHMHGRRYVPIIKALESKGFRNVVLKFDGSYVLISGEKLTDAAMVRRVNLEEAWALSHQLIDTMAHSIAAKHGGSQFKQQSLDAAKTGLAQVRRSLNERFKPYPSAQALLRALASANEQNFTSILPIDSADNLLQAFRDEVARGKSDAAMKSDEFEVRVKHTNAFPGGIDLNTANMGMVVTKDANGGVKIDFDPAMIARIEHDGIDSLTPVVLRMTPVASIWPLVGLPSWLRHSR